jgi:hypothetical protein
VSPSPSRQGAAPSSADRSKAVGRTSNFTRSRVAARDVDVNVARVRAARSRSMPGMLGRRETGTGTGDHTRAAGWTGTQGRGK